MWEKSFRNKLNDTKTEDPRLLYYKLYEELTVGLILVVAAHVGLAGEGEEALLEGDVQGADGPLLVLLRPFQIVNRAPEHTSCMTGLSRDLDVHTSR